MDLFDDLKQKATKLSDDAKNAFNIKQNKLRIKRYFDEADMLFMDIGRIIYKNRDKIQFSEELKLDELFGDIESIGKRIRHLEKNIEETKAGENKSRSIVISEASENYNILSRNESDLEIKRTEEGIKFVRTCPKCSADNLAAEKLCQTCGYEFRKVVSAE
ncbi:hypothetical protein LJB89_02170 [Tyzzerella sp. OttesenSCG-928-J15]|nr:hypothetical protein [Tyzzerella sp. OttesenSCG-928-J15]